MRVKTQGMVGIGIAFLIIGLVIASVGGFTIAFMLKTVFSSGFSGFLPMFIIPCIFFALIAGITIAVGVINLVKGLNGRRILTRGHKSSCTILEKYYTHGYQHHARITHYIIVKYKGDSGQEHHLRVQLDYRNSYRLEKGMVIECYILGEDAYIDLRQEVRIISEEGVSHDFNGPMFF